MARRPPPVVGIRRLEAPEARQAIAPLHAYLRECILDGTLVPGTKLSQVGLADQLGVSRTPVREVLRMLQEEGLVETEPNQRTRVAGVDPAQLDDTCATRILVETLSLSLTLDSLGPQEADRAEGLLTAMSSASASGDLAGWFRDHAAFHRLLTAGGGPSLQRQVRVLADSSIRYIRVYQFASPAHWQEPGDLEHARILAAVRSEDRPAAVEELARHLSGTAHRVLEHCEPGFTPVAVPRALDLVTGRLVTGSSLARRKDDVAVDDLAEAQLDWEVELAIVIDTRCRHVPVERARSVITGYAVANDLSVRGRFPRPDAVFPPFAWDWLGHEGLDSSW